MSKRVLSLVLAFAMILGSFSFVAAEGFTDVPANHYAVREINAMVEAGILEGHGDGTFTPNSNVTRAQFAAMVNRALGLTEEADIEFTDVNEGAWYYEDVAKAVEAGYVEGVGNGRFAPNSSISRQDAATMIGRAFELEVSEVETEFTDADQIRDYALGYVNAAAELGILKGFPAGDFKPATNIKRADAALVVYRAINVEFEVVNVEALTGSGKFIEVTFNQALESLHQSEISIRDSINLSRVGVEAVSLATHGRSAQVTLLGDETLNQILEPNRDYTLTITQGADVTSFKFAIPDVAEESTITGYDLDNRTINIDGEILEFPASMSVDFEELLGREATVWFNSNDEVIRYVLTDQVVKYDAVEWDAGDQELTLVDEDEDYDLAEDVEIRINGESDQDDTDLDPEYDYAKVVFNNRNEVKSINAYNWDDVDGPILVKEIDEEYIVTYEDEFDFEDMVVVKDGKTISLEDINEGDVVFFNDDEDVEYAEVYTNSVTGEIEEIYAGHFVVDGEEYDIAGKYLDDDELKELDEDALEEFQESDEPVTVYLDRKGDVVFLTGEMEEVVSDTVGVFLEEDVIVYQQATRDRVELDFVNENEESKVIDFLLRDIDEIKVDGETVAEVGEDLAGSEVEEFVLIDSSGNQWTGGAATELFIGAIDDNDDVIDGTDVGKLAQVRDTTGADPSNNLLTAGTALEVVTDSDGDVVGLNLYDEVDFDATGAGAEDLEVGDRFVTVAAAESYRLLDSTVVFLHDGGDFEEAIKWGDIKDFDEIDEAVIYHDGADVDYLVVDIDDTDLDADTEDYDAVITEVRTNAAGDEIARLTALINGKERTFTGLSLEDADIEVADIDLVSAGELFTLEVDEDRNTVTDIKAIVNDDSGTLTNVNTSDREITVSGLAGELQLTNDVVLIDASGDDDDIETISLRELRDIKDDADAVLPVAENVTVTVVRAAAGSNYIEMVVITDIN